VKQTPRTAGVISHLQSPAPVIAPTYFHDHPQTSSPRIPNNTTSTKLGVVIKTRTPAPLSHRAEGVEVLGHGLGVPAVGEQVAVRQQRDLRDGGAVNASDGGVRALHEALTKFYAKAGRTNPPTA